MQLRILRLSWAAHTIGSDRGSKTAKTTGETTSLSGRLPHEDEKANANQLRQVLASARVRAGASGCDDEPAQLTVVADDGKPATSALHPSLSELLMEMLRVIGDGDAVMLVPIHKQLSTQQAADLLNVSRPHLTKLLDRGDIPHERVGRHRRMKANDLFDYRDRKARECDEALAELAAIDA